MGKRLSAKQFAKFCEQYGKKSFIRRSIDMHPGWRPQHNKQLNELCSWLDKACVQPYYVTKEYEQSKESNCLVHRIVFYFMDEQDKMVFTLCYGELF